MFFKRIKRSTPEQDERLKENLSKDNLEKGDRFAMLVAALLTIVLPCVLVLLGLCLVALLLCGLL